MTRWWLLCIVLLAGATTTIFAQNQQQESLGEVARQLRQEKAREARKPTKVFTNDNLPAPNPLEPVSQSPPPPSGQPSTSDKASGKITNPPAADQSGSKPDENPEDKLKTREYWQQRFKAARRDLEAAKEQEQLSEDELNLLQIQQVRELDSSVKADLTAQVAAKQSEVEVNKAAVAAPQKALDDLQHEFKESMAPDEWSQTD